MIDFRTILTVIILAIIVWYYFGFLAVLICAALSILIGFFALVYVILRGEGKIKFIVQWLKNAWKYYLKNEAKFFRWLDKF